MRISTATESIRKTSATDTNTRSRHFSKVSSDSARTGSLNWMASGGNALQRLVEAQAEELKKQPTAENVEDEDAPRDRSEATKVYEMACKGGKNPLSTIRTVPKVPYGHMAKDGAISYNGVVFVCDEKTNSICLGDMTDKKQVINIPLSGGGHLKVNRANIGQLSKAIGMFCPEDVNRILSAIHLDTKLQSMQHEVEDLEASVGEEIASDDNAAKTDDH